MVGFAAHGNNLRLGIGDATRIKLFTADTVDDMPLGHSDVRLRHRANDVDLVVFPRKIAGIHINDVIGVVQPKHRIGFVPMNIVNFAISFTHCGQIQADQQQWNEYEK